METQDGNALYAVAMNAQMPRLRRSFVLLLGFLGAEKWMSYI